MIGSRCLKTNGAAPALHLFLGKDEEKLKIIKVISRTAGFHIAFPRQLQPAAAFKSVSTWSGTHRARRICSAGGSARSPWPVEERKLLGGDADVCEVNKRKSEVIMREK